MVFDCDGLLVDTGNLWWAAFEACAADLGGSLDGVDPVALHGASVSTAARLLRRHLGREVSEPLIEQTLAQLVESHAIGAMPGAVRLLTELATRVPTAVATNAPAAVAEVALSRTGLRRLVGPVLSAEATAAPKPAPDVYIEACRALGVPPEEAVAFEDSVVGAGSARAAGMAVVGVPANGNRLQADLVVPRLDDPAVFAALGLDDGPPG